MSCSMLRRLTSFNLALVLFGSTSAVPVHTEVDHTPELAHVEMAHGGHDAVILQDTDHRAVGDKIVLRPVPAVRLALDVPGFIADGHSHDADEPPTRPPDYRSQPRAPPLM